MKLRRIPSILIFISGYSPLAIIFLIRDFDWKTKWFSHPIMMCVIMTTIFISIAITSLSLKCSKSSKPPVKIISVLNRSEKLVIYTMPYMLVFFVVDLSKTKFLLSFIFFMLIMYILTIRTHIIFNNPLFAIIGYNLYDVKYQRDNKEFQSFFIVKGKRLEKDKSYRIIEISESLFLVK